MDAIKVKAMELAIQAMGQNKTPEEYEAVAVKIEGYLRPAFKPAPVQQTDEYGRPI
jgi:hypothetical protein